MLIVFEGDWVRLRLEYRWHRVVDIKTADVVVLDDGREVVAEGVEVGGKIAQLLSENEYYTMKREMYTEWGTC